MSLTSVGYYAPSPLPHNDSCLSVSSSFLDPTHPSPTGSFPNSPLVPVLNPTPTIPIVLNAHPMVARSKKNT